QGLARKTLRARELYGRMMRVLAQTGNGWMTFKDKSNRACNQTAKPGHTVHLSNLCTEILEVTSTIEIAVRQLDRVIDLNYYPIGTARSSNMRWRPVGLGVMGLQDVLFRLRLAFDSQEAQ